MAYILAIISAAGYGLNNFLLQVGMRSGRTSNKHAHMINLISGTIFLGVIELFNLLFSESLDYNWKGFLFFFAAGLSGPFLGRIFNILSIRKIGGTRTSILRMSETLITIFLALIMLREKLSFLSTLGAVILISGILLLMSEKDLSEPEVNSGIDQVGDKGGRLKAKKRISRYVFVFLASIFFSFGKIFNRYGLDNISSPVLGALCGTLIALLGNSLWKNGKGIKKTKIKLPFKDIAFIAASGFSNSLGLFLLLVAMNSGGLVSLVTVLKNTSSLFTLLFSVIFLKKIEKINFKVIASVVIVLTGVIIIVLN